MTTVWITGVLCFCVVSRPGNCYHFVVIAVNDSVVTIRGKFDQPATLDRLLAKELGED